MDEPQLGRTILSVWNTRLNSIRRSNAASFSLTPADCEQEIRWLEALAHDHQQAGEAFATMQTLLHPEWFSNHDIRTIVRDIVVRLRDSGVITQDDAAALEEQLKSPWERQPEDVPGLVAQFRAICSQPSSGNVVALQDAKAITENELRIASSIQRLDHEMQVLAEHADRLFMRSIEGDQLRLVWTTYDENRRIRWR